jgi:hypothetical protein
VSSGPGLVSHPVVEFGISNIEGLCSTRGLVFQFNVVLSLYVVLSEG